MNVATDDDTAFIRGHAAAELLGVSSQTLRRWRAAGFGPRPIRLGPRALGYRRVDLLKFIETAAPA